MTQNTDFNPYEIELWLLLDSDCGTVSKQNCDYLSSSKGSSVRRYTVDAFVLLMAAAPCYFFMAPCINVLTYLLALLTSVASRVTMTTKLYRVAQKSHYGTIKWSKIGLTHIKLILYETQVLLIVQQHTV